MRNLTKEVVDILADTSAKLERMSAEMTENCSREMLLNISEQVEEIMRAEFLMTDEEIDERVNSFITKRGA